MPNTVTLSKKDNTFVVTSVADGLEREYTSFGLNAIESFTDAAHMAADMAIGYDVPLVIQPEVLPTLRDLTADRLYGRRPSDEEVTEDAGTQ